MAIHVTVSDAKLGKDDFADLTGRFIGGLNNAGFDAERNVGVEPQTGAKGLVDFTSFIVGVTASGMLTPTIKALLAIAATYAQQFPDVIISLKFGTKTFEFRMSDASKKDPDSINSQITKK
jgi:hypothetical protein